MSEIKRTLQKAVEGFSKHLLRVKIKGKTATTVEADLEVFGKISLKKSALSTTEVPSRIEKQAPILKSAEVV